MAGATEPHFVAQHFSEPCDPPREDSVAFDCAIFLFLFSLKDDFNFLTHPPLGLSKPRVNTQAYFVNHGKKTAWLLHSNYGGIT